MKDSKTFVIVGLIIAIMIMATGYAALSQRLVVNGVANIDASWDVKIVKIEETAKSITPVEKDPSTSVGDKEGTTVAANTTGATQASFDVTLNAPGDYAEFTVTVQNLGSIAVVLDSLDFDVEETPEEIVFSVTPADATGASTLAADATETYVVRVEWDANSADVPEDTSKEATLTLNYVQAK